MEKQLLEFQVQVQFQLVIPNLLTCSEPNCKRQCPKALCGSIFFNKHFQNIACLRDTDAWWRYHVYTIGEMNIWRVSDHVYTRPCTFQEFPGTKDAALVIPEMFAVCATLSTFKAEQVLSFYQKYSCWWSDSAISIRFYIFFHNKPVQIVPAARKASVSRV